MKVPRLRPSVAILALPVLFVAWLLAVWPPPVWYRSHWPAETAFMRLSRSGTVTRQYHPVPLTAMSPTIAEAVITGEDARFWTHGGIDYQEVRHALGYDRVTFDWSSKRDRGDLWRSLRGNWSKQSGLRGASTITQQLAKNLYFSPSRSPLRKLKEAVTAYRLERALGKSRILELYLNVAELGDGVWGVEAASRRYFSRSADRLSLSQAAGLAATLPFPRHSNPGHRPNRMHRRQELILRRMRGEPIEIPPVPEEPIPQPGDSILWTPGLDSLLDSLRAPIETLPPQSTNRSGITNVR